MKHTFRSYGLFTTVLSTCIWSCAAIWSSTASVLYAQTDPHDCLMCTGDWSNPARDFLDEIVVPADTQQPTTSQVVLETGEQYELEVKGVYSAGDTIAADVDYSFTERISGDYWTDNVSGYTQYGEGLLNLVVLGHSSSESLNWGSFTCSHVYKASVTGTGQPLSFYIYDTYDGNNSGYLTVRIYELAQ